MAKKTISKKARQGSEQFQLRLPDGMRKQLARVAEREGRSMNAEIVHALAMYFANEDASPKESQLSGVETALKDLVDQLANQHQELTELIKKADTDILVQLIKQKIK
jgi:plasmid stability protein